MDSWEMKSKKIDASTYKYISAFKPGISKLTTYDEAWGILCEMTNITCSIGTIDTKKRAATEIQLLYKDKEAAIHGWQLPNEDVWDGNEGDWNWTYIFKMLIEYVKKNKIVKKPRAKKTGNNARKSEELDSCKAKPKNSVKRDKNAVKSKVK